MDEPFRDVAHPAIHARAIHGGAWKILSSWARAS